MASQNKQLILVTGISGFLGGHIVQQLIEDGYRVRGTVRTVKVESIRENFAFYGDDLEVIGFDDLVAGDWTEALKGVDGILHAAAPLPGSQEPQSALDAAVEGALNILHAADKAGITNFVLMSSFATALNPLNPADNNELNEHSWNPVTKAQILDPNSDPMLAYTGYKTSAEQAVWEFADAHPHINITAVLPPFFYGPFAPGHKVVQGVRKWDLSTNSFIYAFLKPDGPFPPSRYIDVRDSARSLILGLKTSPGTKRKRVLVCPTPGIDWKESTEYLLQQRPELKGRIADPAKAPPIDEFRITDNNLQEILHFGEFIPWKQTLLDTVDSLLKLEKEWAASDA
ncbi:NAD(P)-binding protein [Punctularia strigosozonata HHB-11173 SS5]|uniref:NAD(P)-binding protein n=1 Tax=Punctularia strigosozonata (strain HHB-11173) TaxID=741275 RepID=UPI0004416422|nr:NAD(P)-binding protein [Punctularia strigosozonata HHB-11173 SS5]EIN05747.1 NAD(P)-binding protein [Punctularia strigosozonata HHB-11173 SS5]